MTNGRVWRDVEGLVGQYQVSNDGYVRSLPDIDHRGMFMPGRILKPGRNSKGYLRVCIGGRTLRVHVLVAQAFIRNPKRLPQVNHKDGDKENNHRDNLMWCTNSYNQRHRYRVLGHVPAMLGRTGINCPTSKPVVARSVRTRRVVGVYGGAGEAARALGIDASGVSAAARGHMRSYKGCEWEYVSRDRYAALVKA